MLANVTPNQCVVFFSHHTSALTQRSLMYCQHFSARKKHYVNTGFFCPYTPNWHQRTRCEKGQLLRCVMLPLWGWKRCSWTHRKDQNRWSSLYILRLRERKYLSRIQQQQTHGDFPFCFYVFFFSALIHLSEQPIRVTFFTDELPHLHAELAK